MACRFFLSFSIRIVILFQSEFLEDEGLINLNSFHISTSTLEGKALLMGKQRFTYLLLRNTLFTKPAIIFDFRWLWTSDSGRFWSRLYTRKRLVGSFLQRVRGKVQIKVSRSHSIFRTKVHDRKNTVKRCTVYGSFFAVQ